MCFFLCLCTAGAVVRPRAAESSKTIIYVCRQSTCVIPVKCATGCAHAAIHTVSAVTSLRICPQSALSASTPLHTATGREEGADRSTHYK